MDFQEPEEQYEDLLCRLCEQQGEFELSENEFEYENNEVTLLTAFNTFSSLDNVSKTFRMQRIRNCQLKLFFFFVSFQSQERLGRIFVSEMHRPANRSLQIYTASQTLGSECSVQIATH